MVPWRPGFLVLVFWGLATALLGAAPATPVEQQEARTRLLETLQVFDAMVLGGPGTSVVSEIYREIRPNMLNGKLNFAVDSSDKPLLESVSVIHEANLTTVYLGIRIFREERQKPGILMGFIGQGFALARNGFRSTVRPYRPDDIQRVFDAMDALFLHAHFVRDFGSARRSPIHPLEQFLLDSLQNDASAGLQPMATAAMMLLSLDAQILASLAEHGGAAKEGIITAAEYVQKVRALADRLTQASLVAQALTGTDRTAMETKYMAQVSAFTLLRFGVAMVNDHLGRFYPGALQSQAQEIQALNASLDRLQEVSLANRVALGYRQVFLGGLGL